MATTTVGATAATAATDVCVQSVSDGDQQVGIQAFTDPLCHDGGLGCFSTSCRFCKSRETPQSQIFMQCPSASFESTMTSQCAGYVSYGDQKVGISAYYDSICSSGGLGCFGNEGCRYCKQTSTLQSSTFVACPASSASTNSGSNTISCEQAVRNAGLSSISYVNEAKCNRAKVPIVGCVALTNCLLCRNAKTDQNQFLISCKVLQDQQSLLKTSLAIQPHEVAQEAAAIKALEMDKVQALNHSALVGASVGVCGVFFVSVAVSFLRKRVKRWSRKDRESEEGELEQEVVHRETMQHGVDLQSSEQVLANFNKEELAVAQV